MKFARKPSLQLLICSLTVVALTVASWLPAGENIKLPTPGSSQTAADKPEKPQGFDSDPALPAGAENLKQSADVRSATDQRQADGKAVDANEEEEDEIEEKPKGKNKKQPDKPVGKYSTNPRFDNLFARALKIQEKHSPVLMSRKGINGTALGRTKDGKPAIVVLETGADDPVVPKEIEDVPVIRKKVGPLFVHWENPKREFDRPVPIGISAAPAQSVCYSGTLGCRVVKKGGSKTQFYALSNNHVFANSNQALIGTSILQPSPGDNDCSKSNLFRIGSLSEYVPIKYAGQDNFVDAAIARMDSGALGSKTPDDGYGAPKSSVATAFIGMQLMKYGRTTGFTRGVVTAVNATVTVSGYEGGPALFKQQIFYEANPPYISMSLPGDSGSLIVSSSKQPVALNFAGGGGVGIGNPMSLVMAALNVEIPPSSSGKRGRAK